MLSFLRKFTVIMVSLLFAGGLSPDSTAHEGRPVYVEVTEGDALTVTVKWKIPPVLLRGDEPLITLANEGCTQMAGSDAPTLFGAKIFKCETADGALQLSLSYPGSNPVLSTLVLYRRANGGEYTIMAGPGEHFITLPEKETFAQVAAQYSWSGFEHILEGYDHLLFVFCLVLLVGQFRKTLIVITGFTLGHSITLGLTALAHLSLPPTFVEPLIAFSILILAAEKASTGEQTLIRRYPTAIATGFGLLHGLGFGGALAEIGLPQTLQLQALAFFNIGVELGQALFVLLLFAVYALVQLFGKLVAAKPDPKMFGQLAIYPAGLIAGYWTIERVVGIWA